MSDAQSYDLTAEQAILGAAMNSPEHRDLFVSLLADDWFNPVHRHIAAVITGLLTTDRPVTPETVLVEAQSRGLVPHRVDVMKLMKCHEVAALPASVPMLVDRLRNLATARALSGIGTRLAQRMESAWTTGDDPADIAAAIAEVRRACDDAERRTADLTLPPPMPMGDFLAIEDLRSWIIPGLLERMERIVLTGAEGGGKTVLCSQLACCMAAGVHPFTGEPLGAGHRGIRVLVVDCENSPAQSRRRFRWMVSMVDAARTKHGLTATEWSDQMFIEMRPAGIDLLSPRDTAWLDRTVTATSPDLLVLGPLYKLHHANANDESAARELVWQLDLLREKHGFALLTEAHAGNASDGNGDRMMRPSGSSLFRRWSEFGFGLRRAKNDPGRPRAELVDVVSWRGSREERAWPTQLQHGTTLPWMPADPAYYDTLPRRSA
ncbi:AAA family ATPase [Nocardia sp. IBHARD005]|uniref:AAA family ATPase n=1 Tax=Nocardia sp. IBHARD005 TaxID=3457765 RepID=UPI004059E7C7